MLPELLSMPLLCFYWFRLCSRPGTAAAVPAILMICGNILICSLDYWVISPFSASLFDHFSL